MTARTFAFVSSIADPSLPRFRIDPVQDGLTDAGIPFLVDLFKDFEASHADAAYANGEAITDLSGNGDGSMIVASGHTVTSGVDHGGADFSAITSSLGGTAVTGPAGCLSGLQATQHFLVLAYVKLPIADDWNDGAALAPFFQSSAGGYTGGPDLVTIAQAAGGALQARRQTNGSSTVVTLEIVVDAGAYGEWAQIAFWRNAAGAGLRLKTADVEQTATTSAGADNSGSFASTLPQFGQPAGFWNMGAIAAHVDASNYIIGRLVIENLAETARSPLVVADADAARVFGRIAAMDA